MANIEKTYSILKSAYKIRHDIVPLIVGAPGIGKTQSVYRLAKELGVNVVEINANQAMPSEISGMAMPSHDSQIMEYYDDSLLMNLKDGDILFFDEVLTAPSVVLNAFLKLLMDRRLRSGKLLPDVFIVAAGNIPKSGLREFTAPQLQRFMPIFMSWDEEEWHQYLVDRYGEERIPAHDKRVWMNLMLKIKSSLQDLTNQEYTWNDKTPRRIVQYLDWVVADGEDAKQAIREITNRDVDISEFLEWFLHPVAPPQTQLEYKLEELSDLFGVSFADKDPSEILAYAKEVMGEGKEYEQFCKLLSEEEMREDD